MITRALRYLLDNAAIPAALTAAGIAVPLFGILLRIPILGEIIRRGIQAAIDDLFEKSAIEVKMELIDRLSDAAKEKYAPQIALLQEAQSRPALTPAEEEEYAKRLQELGKNRPGIVNG